jgi:hypothetical protein
MSWNEIFWWLAILTLSLAFAQFGVRSLSRAARTWPFKHEVYRWVRKAMKIFPNFLAVLSIAALVVALVAGLELITGLGRDMAVVIARHFGYANNTDLIMLTQIALCLAMLAIIFFILRYLWRFSATLGSRGQDTASINADIRQHIKEIKDGNTKPRGK